MFEPIEIPPELRRKRARYRLTVLAVVGAFVFVLITFGIVPADKDATALGLSDELAGPQSKERAVQAYMCTGTMSVRSGRCSQPRARATPKPRSCLA